MKTNNLFQKGGLLDWMFTTPEEKKPVDTKKEASNLSAKSLMDSQSKTIGEVKNPEELAIREYLNSKGYTVIRNKDNANGYAVIVNSLGETVGRLEETTTLVEIKNLFPDKDKNYTEFDYKFGGKLKLNRIK